MVAEYSRVELSGLSVGGNGERHEAMRRRRLDFLQACKMISIGGHQQITVICPRALVADAPKNQIYGCNSLVLQELF